ncbi:MAG: hypothetical protein WKF91_02740 [Segetibacter sp.]
MKNFFFFTFYSLLTIAVTAQGHHNSLKSQLNKRRVTLPNGWSLSPAGSSLPLGDLPLNMAVSSSKRWIAVTNNGFGVQSIQLIDAYTEKISDEAIIPKLWYGLKFSDDEKFLYASGGNDNRILKYAIINNKLQLKDSIILGEKWPVNISPAGIETDDTQRLLYVVTKGNNTLYIADLTTNKIIHQQKLIRACCHQIKKNCTSHFGEVIKF